MISENLTVEICKQLSLLHSCEVNIISTRHASGGSINTAVYLFTSVGKYFLKTNNAIRFPGMFDCEAKGIRLLKATNTVNVPEVFATGVVDNLSYLLLENIERGNQTNDYWEQAGGQLALLHQVFSDSFGLNHNNYIGSLKQENSNMLSGFDFMVENRFKPIVKLAFDYGYLDKSHINLFEQLYANLPELLPNEVASLLHGDLWNGNIITGPNGGAWFIDPAVYYGYRETDLAMAKLFSGFDDRFFNSYNAAFPLVKGWESRIQLFQLYPLLVHLNLFGTGYKADVLSILKRYS